MNRRQAIKAACATVAMPSHLILSSPPERIFSVASGDLGRVYLDGRQVKAIACCPDEGWVECFADENGRPLGLSEPAMILDGQPITARVYGKVRFEPGVEM